MEKQDLQDYKSFKSYVALRRTTTDMDKEWAYYDFGPQNIVPLICLPGISGTADVFWKQIKGLSSRGYRVISVQPGAYTTFVDWVKGFERFLDNLKLRQVHLFGIGLGGYLAQCFIQFRPKRVLSLVLCNTYCSTAPVVNQATVSKFFTFTPAFVLRNIVLSQFPTQKVSADVLASVDFMVDQVEKLFSIKFNTYFPTRLLDPISITNLT
eukprot:TRINITY_DN5967_c0_g1_i4.p1 TRINITY_DN5967_c0_g1~~TRINITY_DN5967_c0_g1_i4.p1  ORF type:complete len:210 (-),score=33.25 TRINITY_DN5967_c0_g1_i4:274-903(-)